MTIPIELNPECEVVEVQYSRSINCGHRDDRLNFMLKSCTIDAANFVGCYFCVDFRIYVVSSVKQSLQSGLLVIKSMQYRSAPSDMPMIALPFSVYSSISSFLEQ